jgi:hypothetical protein
MEHWGGSAVLGSPQVEQLPSLGMGRDKGDGAGGQGRIITSQSPLTSHHSPAPSPQSQIWDLGQMVNTQK